MENKSTLIFAMEMIQRLSDKDPGRAAGMAVSLHQNEEVLARLDKIGMAVAGFVAARAASDDALSAARETREAAESAARVRESDARTAAEAARDARDAQDHQIRLAEIRERAERHAAMGVSNPHIDAVLNRI